MPTFCGHEVKSGRPNTRRGEKSSPSHVMSCVYLDLILSIHPVSQSVSQLISSICQLSSFPSITWLYHHALHLVHINIVLQLLEWFKMSVFVPGRGKRKCERHRQTSLSFSQTCSHEPCASTAVGPCFALLCLCTLRARKNCCPGAYTTLWMKEKRSILSCHLKKRLSFRGRNKGEPWKVTPFPLCDGRGSKVPCQPQMRVLYYGRRGQCKKV